MKIPLVIGWITLATTSGFAQDPGTACPLYGPSYRLQSDTVTWSMTLTSGQSCIRGLRSAFATLSGVKLVTPPEAGQVTVEGPGFIYKTAPDFRGEDSFAFSVSGKSYGINGNSVIQVTVSIK